MRVFFFVFVIIIIIIFFAKSCVLWQLIVAWCFNAQHSVYLRNKAPPEVLKKLKEDAEAKKRELAAAAAAAAATATATAASVAAAQSVPAMASPLIRASAVAATSRIDIDPFVAKLAEFLLDQPDQTACASKASMAIKLPKPKAFVLSHTAHFEWIPDGGPGLSK